MIIILNKNICICMHRLNCYYDVVFVLLLKKQHIPTLILYQITNIRTTAGQRHGIGVWATTHDPSNLNRNPPHARIRRVFRSTSLVDALATSAYDGVSHVRCIFWEPESLGRASVVSVSHDKNLTYPGYYHYEPGSQCYTLKKV